METAEAAVAAERIGVDRIELCERLDIGGTTPSLSLIKDVLWRVRVPVFVMVRPRGGGFTYSDDEIGSMVKDVRRIRSLGAAGIVTGVVNHDGEVDTPQLRRLVRAAGELPVTFHRAFDSLREPLVGIEVLIDLGVRRVLTSGGAASALAGAGKIAELVKGARGRIGIIAGGGVRGDNAREIIERTGVGEVHARYVDEEQMRALVDAVRTWAVRDRSFS